MRFWPPVKSDMLIPIDCYQVSLVLCVRMSSYDGYVPDQQGGVRVQ